MTIIVQVCMKHASPGQALEVRQVFDDGSIFATEILRSGDTREILVYEPLALSFHPVQEPALCPA